MHIQTFRTSKIVVDGHCFRCCKSAPRPPSPSFNLSLLRNWGLFPLKTLQLPCYAYITRRFKVPIKYLRIMVDLKSDLGGNAAFTMSRDFYILQLSILTIGKCSNGRTQLLQLISIGTHVKFIVPYRLSLSSFCLPQYHHFHFLVSSFLIFD